jgi:hypothetical protein
VINPNFEIMYIIKQWGYIYKFIFSMTIWRIWSIIVRIISNKSHARKIKKPLKTVP